MYDNFKRFSIAGLYASSDNLDQIAGHKRLFGDAPFKGWVFYHYNQLAPDWALHRVWNFGLVCLHHIGEGKACDPPGWHLTFAKIKREKSHRGFTLRFELADNHRATRHP